MSKDVLGRNVIEVKKDGDFETDAVLQLFVPLVELDTGEVVAGGIVSVKNNGDTVTLTVREAAPLDGKARVGTAKAVIIGPAPLNGCEGVLNNGQFDCAREAAVCANACEQKTIHEGSTTICDCKPAA